MQAIDETKDCVYIKIFIWELERVGVYTLHEGALKYNP